MQEHRGRPGNPPARQEGPGLGGALRALVVVPTYQEARTVGRALDALASAAPDVHALVVDDGSPDGTADLVADIALQRPRVHLLRRSAKQGLGSAYRAGFAWGLEHGFEALVEMDADLSHDPAAVPLLLSALGEADLVIGSRYVPGGEIPDWTWHRRFLSRYGNLYSALVLGLPLTDLTSGFRAYRADLLSHIGLDSARAGGYGFQIEMAFRAASCGARVTEIPIRFSDRTEGTSKMSVGIAVEALLRVTGWGLRQRLLPTAPTHQTALPLVAPQPSPGGGQGQPHFTGSLLQNE